MNIGLHGLRGHEFDGVSQLGDFPRPVVRAATGFQTDEARRQLCQQGQDLFARDAFVQHHIAVSVDAVELEDLFCRINAERGNLCHREPSCERGDDICYPHHDRHPRGCTAGWVHTINIGTLFSSATAQEMPGHLHAWLRGYGVLPLAARHG